jgi:hypothetical protein
MRKLRFVLPILLLLGMGLLASFIRGSVSAQDKAPPHKIEWEYRVEQPETDLKEMSDALNKRGKDGWEFAGTTRLSHTDATSYIIYKRQTR